MSYGYEIHTLPASYTGSQKVEKHWRKLLIKCILRWDTRIIMRYNRVSCEPSLQTRARGEGKSYKDIDAHDNIKPQEEKVWKEIDTANKSKNAAY